MGHPRSAADSAIAMVVVESDRAFLDGLLAAATTHQGIDLVATWTGVDALEEAIRSGTLDPAAVDLVAVSIGLGHGGVHACTTVAGLLPTVRLLALAEQEDHRCLVEALEAGAHGYAARSAGPDACLAAAQAVTRGESAVPRRMLAGLLDELIERRRSVESAAAQYARLSRREREILGMLGRGLDQETIADVLVISPQTARTHIQNVMTKLGVHTRAEAAEFAAQNGFLDTRGPPAGRPETKGGPVWT
ncbi:MAG: response regulator transcription factor [Actinomycetes bacterium]